MYPHYQPVFATKITEKKIYYECPYCYTLPSGKVVFSPYKKNGSIYKTAKKTIHNHGNDTGKLENRYFCRFGHCTSPENGEIKIIVNDDTSKE